MNRPALSRLYPHMSKAMEKAGMAERRQTLLAGLTGEVIEIGAGDGANFTQYTSIVTRVLAIEPEPRLRQLAVAAARQAPVPILVGGCHTGRDTQRAITRAGFTIEHLDRFLFPEARTPVSFHFLGTASRDSMSK